MSTARRIFGGSQWGVVLASWTLFGLFFATQRYIERAYMGRPTTWAKVLTAWACMAYLWAGLTPLVLRLARRFPFERGRWLRSLAAHSVAGLAFSVLHLGLYTLLLELLLGDSSRPFATFSGYLTLTVAELHFNLLLYAAVVGVGHAAAFYRAKRERELAASRLEAGLARARLDALRAQLQPHFLFNTLNTISVLTLKDPVAANRVLLRLSNLLRSVLRGGDAHEVALSDELEFLRDYLEIERARFGERLAVGVAASEEARGARVPALVLQPLVENSIRHGAGRRAEGGRVEVSAERRNGALHLRVSDNGPGPDAAPSDEVVESHRVGLANTRERLRQMYGGAHRFDLRESEDGGTVVTIDIPFRPFDKASRRDDAREA